MYSPRRGLYPTSLGKGVTFWENVLVHFVHFVHICSSLRNPFQVICLTNPSIHTSTNLTRTGLVVTSTGPENFHQNHRYGNLNQSSHQALIFSISCKITYQISGFYQYFDAFTLNHKFRPNSWFFTTKLSLEWVNLTHPCPSPFKV